MIKMKKKIIKYLFILILGLFLIPFISSAHPGGTDAYGCHTCRTNCPNWGLSYGEYHCHRAKSLPQPEEPIRSRFGEGGTGFTEPAQEYKIPSPQIQAPPVTNPPTKSVPSPIKNQQQLIPSQKIETPQKSQKTAQINLKQTIQKQEEPKLNFFQKIFRWFGWYR